MSAILKAMDWLWPIGLPKAVRSRLYLTDSSTQPWLRPVASAEMAMRPSSRIRRNCAYPRPGPPTRFSAGTRTSSKNNSWVSEAFHPTLEYFGATVKPGVPLGTMIALIPPSGVRAVTVTKAVMSVPELVMNTLDPLMTHSSPSSRAVVPMRPASEPEDDSVSPKAARCLPDVSMGRYRRRCSSVPKR